MKKTNFSWGCFRGGGAFALPCQTVYLPLFQGCAGWTCFLVYIACLQMFLSIGFTLSRPQQTIISFFTVLTHVFFGRPREDVTATSIVVTLFIQSELYWTYPYKVATQRGSCPSNELSASI